MNNSVFFILGLSLIIVHEMDAIRCKEWRIFPGLSMLKEKTGQIIFLFAHIPVFCWLLFQITNGTGSETFRIVFDIFLILHFGLHLIFLKHKNNEFKDWISWSIITGAGICGILDLYII